MHAAAANSAIDDALAEVIVVADERDDPSISKRLSRDVERGELVRLTRGLYISAATVKPLAPWNRELLRALAAATFGRVAQPLAGRSAARVWGVPLLEDDFEPIVDALAWHGRASRRVADVHYWGNHDSNAHVVEHHGVHVTDLPRTIAEFATRETFARSVAAIDWATRVRHRRGEPHTTPEQIESAADALGLVRGRARLRRAIEFADGRSESPGESWFRVLVHELGFEVPDVQHEYRMLDGRTFRSDFRWHSIRLAGEFDGLTKYRTSELRAGKTAEQVIVEEKEREDAVRSTGDGVLRAVWTDLRNRSLFRQRLEAAGVPRRRRSPGRTPFVASHMTGSV